MRAKYARGACLLLGVGAIALIARHVDWVGVQRSLWALGPRAPLIALPYVLVLVGDTLGWRATFEHSDHVRLVMLWRIRVATDAVMNSLPGGAALGEALKVVLLKRCFAVTVPEGVANVAISKLALAVTQAVFLVVGVVLAASDLARHSLELIGREGLELYSLFGAVGLLLLVLLVVYAIGSGMLVRVLVRLRGMAREPWKSRLHRFETPLAGIDHGLAVARRVPGRQVLSSIALFFCGYLCLSFESWLILHLLGADISYTRALSMEALVSVLRVAFFFIPSALGAQEVGYYSLLKLYGVPHPEAIVAAFALIKRTKEVAWIALGYALLAGLPASVSEVRPHDSAA